VETTNESLARDDLVWHLGHVGPFARVGTVLGLELEGQLHALAERQRVGVVEEVHLRLARLARVHSPNCSVLLV
jgi:hypothetical protein